MGRRRASAVHPSIRRGLTGKPKGVQHSTGGYLLWAAQTMKWTFDWKPTDVFWCTADIGWVTGHTYITYGPLARGGTQVVFEGVPTLPGRRALLKMIGDHKVTVFYTAPTAIRSLIKAAEADDKVHPKSYDLSSLRIIGTVGEPINPEAWMWYHKHVGCERCPIVDTWWQTETGGYMTRRCRARRRPCPVRARCRCRASWPRWSTKPAATCRTGRAASFVVKRPWPAMIRTIWGDPERFKKSYYPEELGGRLYLAGDGTVRDKDTGYFTIMGRIDDVLNVSGHRLGTMEIESALVSHGFVAEAAVVGRPDDTTGEAVVAFVVLKRSRPEGERKRRRWRRRCVTGSASRSGRSRSRRTSASATTCRRRARARSCGACCVRSRRARSRRTRPRSRTRPSSSSSPKCADRTGCASRALLRGNPDCPRRLCYITA